MKIAREGWEIVGGVFLVAVIVTLFTDGFSWLFWIAFVFVVQFFRDPERTITAVDNAILSPADGRVVFVGEAISPVDNSSRLKISIFMNVFNVHANRIPIGGTVQQTTHYPGSFLNAELDKASEQNERHVLELDTDCGNVHCIQIAGLLARRILCYPKTGDVVQTGQRYGFIRFGSRVDVYLPLNCHPTVAISDNLIAGLNLIARYDNSSEKTT